MPDKMKLAPAFTSPLVAYGCMGLWVALSAAVIMLNKWILDPNMGKFPFPLTLTASHMAFCSLAAFTMVHAGMVAKPPSINGDLFIRTVLPIGALFALTLWLGNTAYVYLSISFIQMLKAVMPLAVYATGCVFKTESPSWPLFGNLAVVVGGVVVATFGEVNFVLKGVAAQVTSIAMEATRLTLVQVLLQGTNIRFNPISTMYYVSPVCLGCLLAPMVMLEAPRLMDAAEWTQVGSGILLLSSAMAFALNLSVLLFIGKTSALTMNLAGILKDWVLIGLSVALYSSRTTTLQLAGYSIALCGVVYYNYHKLHKSGSPAADQQQQQQQSEHQKVPVQRRGDAEAGSGGADADGTDVRGQTQGQGESSPLLPKQ